VLVLSGDLHMCGRAFGPGDCLESPAGSMHGLATTQGGCLVLIQHAS
jgi:hypothetical protein